MSPQNESPNPNEIEEIDVDAILERIEALEKKSASFEKIQSEFRAEFDDLSTYVADLANAIEALGDSN